MRGSSLLCWGWNKQGRVGHGYVGIAVGPGEPPAGDGPSDAPVTWSAIAAGASHTCGVRNGELLCWGAHGRGQTGLGQVQR